MAIHVDDFPAALDGTTPVKIKYNGRDHWLSIRRQFIGGSESAVLLGASLFGSLYSMYMEKTEQAPDDFTDNTRMQWGRRLEASIRDGIAEDLGYANDECLYCDTTYFHMSGEYAHARVGSTPDGVFTHPSDAVIEALGDVKGPGIFEIKNVDGLMHREKWTDGEPPLQYIIQLQHYMAVMGYEWGALGALVGGNDPQVYFYRRHEPTIVAIIEASANFWRQVDERKVPPVDGSVATENTIKAMHPRSTVESVDLSGDNELPELCSQYLEVKAKERDHGKQARELRNKIMAKVGDAGLVYANGYTLKAPSRDVEAYMVKARTQRTLTIKEVA